MPFGMKSLAATFQHLINMVIIELDNCKSRKENPQKLTQVSSRSHPRHIDDAIIYSDEWNQQLKTIGEFFDRLIQAILTINAAKNEFCHATLIF